MSEKNIVIDACLARAYGNSGQGSSKVCREFFETFLNKTNHKVVFTDAILLEWKKHRSKNSAKWQSQIYSKKRFIKIDLPINDALLEKVARPHRGQKNIEQISKDFHLVLAALASDRRVVSLDENVKKLLDISSGTVSELKNILWLNPESDCDGCIKWLSEGAKDHRKHRLGFKGSQSR